MGKNIRKLHESFQHALRGLGLCIQGERNFRVHMVAAFYVTVFALMGRANAAEGAILCLCFGLTMGAELMNTAIERLCDRQASGYDGFVRNAKDIAAAGVFVCAVACVAVGVCIFLGEGVLWTAVQFLLAHLWAVMALLVTVPAALWFIFHYGRIQ
ncbi:diacylglycerol kinase family protein [Agathobaculum sp. Marseille-P7918]|uniref:diacylglycerol kinase family protein n=1 Tax=Agathobaculum sp. Marseille-P7918 TaxID=2479843 RepID=UPI000F6388FE|nr:diacylglycerol kinase family protein [Agathobaculum sp. Marseille-P7918]